MLPLLDKWLAVRLATKRSPKESSGTGYWNTLCLDSPPKIEML